MQEGVGRRSQDIHDLSPPAARGCSLSNHSPVRRGTDPRGLYLLTPDIADTGRLLERTAPLLPFATWLQYRNKAATQALRREQLQELWPLCEAAQVPLVVNDDWPLAAELGLSGAHLGANDGEIAQAREALGPKALIGASCYNEIGRAHAAIRAGTSYIAFGAFFPSPTKPQAKRATLSLLKETATLGVLRVAIGGITPHNGQILTRSGADLLAVIGGVFDAANPVIAAQAYLSLFDPAPFTAPSLPTGEGLNSI